ncbi:elongation factor P-like protein YeiP [Halieaceae bacterium IMCC14734]|uniref:Elongation factor P-like protein n=1 Tax=Candidatus Litorirhabdus singularis TaxID=2518993 RepID=A0ABT3TCT7_9GAMM|nr:elongation factor P-like protein YeiP [Candidatus Litorirhabdus singularis]MCX2979259.1 elongation factor P-like protein YeiP [Candidatus Litorirhabdus singularis]
MPKASDLKRGSVVAINGHPYIVNNIDIKAPSSRGANTLYKVRFNHAQTKQKLDETFKGEDMLEDIALERRRVQYSYMDGEFYVFMDAEDYSQYTLAEDMLGDQVQYITDGLEGIMGLLVEGEIIAIELPQSVVLEITECAPAIKGASASARSKPATFASGLVVQVPEYLESGERVRINTQEGRYMSRE